MFDLELGREGGRGRRDAPDAVDDEGVDCQSVGSDAEIQDFGWIGHG